ncbi:hypothetical protein GN956_G4046 [Arapaima gigas]
MDHKFPAGDHLRLSENLRLKAWSLRLLDVYAVGSGKSEGHIRCHCAGHSVEPQRRLKAHDGAASHGSGGLFWESSGVSVMLRAHCHHPIIFSVRSAISQGTEKHRKPPALQKTWGSAADRRCKLSREVKAEREDYELRCG